MSFFNNLLWKAKRGIIFFFTFLLVASAIYVLIIVRERSKGPIFSAIIDADTGNGISDLLAISRAIADPGFEVIGLMSVQWNQYPDATGKTVELSQDLNDTLLRLFRREFILHPKGGEEMLRYGNEATLFPSEASEFIVKKAHEASRDRKLNIITLGAMTNLATAILTDSTIIPNLRVYSLAMQYDQATKVWNKNEFNIRNDLDALDLVLNTDKLEMHIMPVSTSGVLILGEDEIVDQMKNNGEPWDYLADQWLEKYHGRKEVKIPDVALIEAILKPDYAAEEQTNTPPENKSRKVFVYTSINKEFMKIDFWKAVKRYISENS
jgi:purine nucleosidase